MGEITARRGRARSAAEPKPLNSGRYRSPRRRAASPPTDPLAAWCSGSTLIGPSEIAALRAAGIGEVVVARLEPGDVTEDQAAAEIAGAVAGEGVRVDRAFTGRANLFAEEPGVLVVDKTAIDCLNLIDEAVTFATLPAFKPVVAGDDRTVKIIPFAVASAVRDASVAVARSKAPLIRVAPYRSTRSGWSRPCCRGLPPR